MSPALILSRKAPQPWGKHVSVPPVLFLESRTRTYCPSQATSTHSLPLTPDLVLFRQVRASGRPGAAVGFFPGVQEGTCNMVALLMSTRVDFPPCLAIRRKSSRRPEKVPEASGGTSVLTGPANLIYAILSAWSVSRSSPAAYCLLGLTTPHGHNWLSSCRKGPVPGDRTLPDLGGSCPAVAPGQRAIPDPPGRGWHLR